MASPERLLWLQAVDIATFMAFSWYFAVPCRMRRPHYANHPIVMIDALWYGVVRKVLSSVGLSPNTRGDMTSSILIVDRNQAIRKATRDFIEGHTVFSVCGEASDGLEAVDKARKLRPDLIILDIKMAGLNGLQAARAIRRISAAPIILFTFYADAIGPKDVLSAGIDAVVSKVADISLLTDQVKLLLDKPVAMGMSG